MHGPRPRLPSPARLPSHPSAFPCPCPPTWSEFQHVSSLASNMCFFPNCFASRLSTELTLQGHVPPSQGHNRDRVSNGTGVSRRPRGQRVAPRRDPPEGVAAAPRCRLSPGGAGTHREAVPAQIRGSTGIAACGEVGSARGKNGDTQQR